MATWKPSYNTPKDESQELWMSAYGGRAIPFLAMLSWGAMALLWLIGVVFAYMTLGYLIPESYIGATGRMVAAAASVTGLYAVKLFLFNREDFGGLHIFATIVIILILGSYDFISLYGHTGYQDNLENSRNGVIKVVEDFVFSANSALRNQESKVVQHDIDERARLEQERTNRKAQVDEDARQSLSKAKSRAEDANFTADEEAAGVRTERTSGLTGDASFTKERRAEAARLEAAAATAASELATWSAAEKTKVDTETATKLTALDATTAARKEALVQAKEGIVSLTVFEDTGARTEVRRAEDVETVGIMTAIHNASDLLSLSKSARRANAQMSKVAGLLGIDSKDAVVTSQNVVAMAFTALFAPDVTAFWTWMLMTGLQSVNLLAAIAAHRRPRNFRNYAEDEC